jgi:hypothetical protein
MPSPASSQRRSPSATRAVEGSPASMVIAAARAEPPASSSSMMFGSLQRARRGRLGIRVVHDREHVGYSSGVRSFEFRLI